MGCVIKSGSCGPLWPADAVSDVAGGAEGGAADASLGGGGPVSGVSEVAIAAYVVGFAMATSAIVGIAWGEIRGRRRGKRRENKREGEERGAREIERER